MKKIISLVLVLVLALSAIGGTLAYFTDNEHATNTFTVGSVDIQLLESKFYTNVVEKTDEEIRADAATYQNYLKNEAGKDVVPGREFMKAIYVDNTGKNDAYVRVRMFVTPSQFNSFYFIENTTALEDTKKLTKTIIGHKDETTKTYADVAAAKADIANWDKLEYIYTYTDALTAGDLTAISPVWKFQMKNDLDNEDVQNLDTSIEVYADAIQAEGFKSAEEAFKAFAGQKGAGADHPNQTDKTDTKFGDKVVTE